MTTSPFAEASTAACMLMYCCEPSKDTILVVLNIRHGRVRNKKSKWIFISYPYQEWGFCDSWTTNVRSINSLSNIYSPNKNGSKQTNMNLQVHSL